MFGNIGRSITNAVSGLGSGFGNFDFGSIGSGLSGVVSQVNKINNKVLKQVGKPTAGTLFGTKLPGPMGDAIDKSINNLLPPAVVDLKEKLTNNPITQVIDKGLDDAHGMVLQGLQTASSIPGLEALGDTAVAWGAADPKKVEDFSNKLSSSQKRLKKRSEAFIIAEDASSSQRKAKAALKVIAAEKKAIEKELKRLNLSIPENTEGAGFEKALRQLKKAWSDFLQAVETVETDLQVALPLIADSEFVTNTLSDLTDKVAGLVEKVGNLNESNLSEVKSEVLAFKSSLNGRSARVWKSSGTSNAQLVKAFDDQINFIHEKADELENYVSGFSNAQVMSDFNDRLMQIISSCTSLMESLEMETIDSAVEEMESIAESARLLEIPQLLTCSTSREATEGMKTQKQQVIERVETLLESISTARDQAIMLKERQEMEAALQRSAPAEVITSKLETLNPGEISMPNMESLTTVPMVDFETPEFSVPKFEAPMPQALTPDTSDMVEIQPNVVNRLPSTEVQVNEENVVILDDDSDVVDVRSESNNSDEPEEGWKGFSNSEMIAATGVGVAILSLAATTVIALRK